MGLHLPVSRYFAITHEQESCKACIFLTVAAWAALMLCALPTHLTSVTLAASILRLANLVRPCCSFSDLYRPCSRLVQWCLGGTHLFALCTSCVEGPCKERHMTQTYTHTCTACSLRASHHARPECAGSVKPGIAETVAGWQFVPCHPLPCCLPFCIEIMCALHCDRKKCIIMQA